MHSIWWRGRFAFAAGAIFGDFGLWTSLGRHFTWQAHYFQYVSTLALPFLEEIRRPHDPLVFPNSDIWAPSCLPFPWLHPLEMSPEPHTPTKKAGQEECNEKQCCHEDVYRFSIIFLVLLHNFQKPWISDKTEWDGFEIATCLSHLIRISQKIFRSCLDFLTTFIYIRPFVLQSSWQWDGHHQACSPSGNIVETGKSYNIKICPCSHMYTYDTLNLLRGTLGLMINSLKV